LKSLHVNLPVVVVIGPPTAAHTRIGKGHRTNNSEDVRRALDDLSAAIEMRQLTGPSVRVIEWMRCSALVRCGNWGQVTSTSIFFSKLSTILVVFRSRKSFF
jgi:hypothetical protein